MSVLDKGGSAGESGAEASLAPDRDLARRFLAVRPPPGRLLCCAVTGSHCYGFPSPDSDLDLKGIHLAKTEELLGLFAPPETHDVLQMFEGVEHDLTTHEAGKALSLLLRGNGNMLERIWSPLQVVDCPELADLRELARGALSRRAFDHYRGFFTGICKEHERTGERTAKALLYAYRVALTGVNLLLEREVECDLRALAPRYGFPEAADLAGRKRRTAEKVVLSEEEDARHRAAWPRLVELLEDARARTTLPDEPQNKAECSAWLVALRRRELEGVR
jgi:predicted nucleotidyltransferase